MRLSRTALAAGLLAASSAFALAQPAPWQGGPGGPRMQPRFSAEDMAAFSEARIAALKAGLKLTPEQEKHWPAFEAVARERAKARADRWAARRAEWTARMDAQPGERPPFDPVANLRRRAEMMSAAAASATKLADAVEPLLKSLDDAQRRRFHMLARLEGAGSPGEGRGWRRGGDDRDGDRGGWRRGEGRDREWRGRGDRGER